MSALYKYQSMWYWITNAIYYRSLTYFYAANPGMHLGGMLDDRKTQVYDMVADRYLPTTIKATSMDGMAQLLSDVGLTFPVMIKPDIGFKGFMVRKVESIEELSDCMDQAEGREMLIQEYLDQPHEYSIMCYWQSDERRYGISSLVEKHLPQIIGDGQSTIAELIRQNGSAFLNDKIVADNMRDRMDEVPKSGQRITIDHVGNYARGSKFESLMDEINPQLEEAVNDFFSGVQGINFGRLDVKAESFGALCRGEFKLLEINGAKAEPIHIYDPRMSMIDVMRATRRHWQILLKIVRENKKDVRTISNRDGIRSLIALNKTVSK